MKQFFWSIPLIVIIGCTGGEFPDPSVPITINMGLSSKDASLERVKKIVLAVNAADFSPIEKSLEAPFSDPVEFSVEVPAGEKRLFEVTASLTGDPLIGYYGKTTVDVTAEGGSIPINLQFINFMTDHLDDVSSGPDISSIGFNVDTMGTSKVGDDLIKLKVNFVDSVASSNLAVFVEFDKDDLASTGRSQNLLDQLKGTIPLTSTSGSDAVILAETIDSGLKTTIFSGDLQAVTVEDSDQLSSSLPDSKQLIISLTAGGFGKNIDSDGVGGFNILVGTKSSKSALQTPQFSGFTASDVAIGKETIGTAVYNAYFDTSGL